MVRSATPVGIKVVCLVWLLFALLNGVQVGRVLTATPLSGELLVPIGLITVLSAAYVAVSVGLWRTRAWAWKGALGLVVVGGATALVQGVYGLPVGFLMLLVGIYLVVRRDVFADESVSAS
ncbi:hypothetical protein [Halorubrum amylolyticum]|uniref:hypothetical protein n=1 Tax=Halorubrum amylolyticum TaxID=2508724 RepID=UPI001008E6E6|nr:hypothetical protein [Halorubrum amylolyticum]